MYASCTSRLRRLVRAPTEPLHTYEYEYARTLVAVGRAHFRHTRAPVPRRTGEAERRFSFRTRIFAAFVAACLVGLLYGRHCPPVS